MRALFCSLDARGFLYPQVGVGLELLRHGHSVAFATNLTWAEVLAQLGLTRCMRSVPDGESFHVQLWGHPVAIAIQREHAARAIDEFRPDVVVASELAIGALIAARRARVPTVVLGLATLPWPSAAWGSEPGSPVQARARWRRTELEKMLANVPGATEDDKRLGTPLDAAVLYLLQSTPTLMRMAGIVPPGNVRLVGSCIWEPAEGDHELESWLSDRRPGALVYAHQGTTFGQAQFWPALLEEAYEADFALCASYGRAKDIRDTTSEVVYARRHVGQQRVLGLADCVVASATSTPVLGALGRDLPMVLLPAGGEQLDLAEICRGLEDVTVVAPDDVASGGLGEAIRSLAGLRPRRAVATELRAQGGPTAAAREIMRLAVPAGAGVGANS